MYRIIKLNSVVAISLVIGLSLVSIGLVEAGQVGGIPAFRQFDVSSLAVVPLWKTETLDVPALLQEDIWRQEQGLPLRYALSQDVYLSPKTDGSWEALPDGSRLWRVRISNPGAKSLNFGFTRFKLPTGTKMLIYSADNSGSVLAFGAEDNRSHQELWTPILLTDEAVVELIVPAGEIITEENLVLGKVGCGYLDFGRQLDKAGSCNIDVVCSEGDHWWNEIRAEAVYSTGGQTFCSGAMINNAEQDGLPLFLTANHCNLSAGNASSVVVYWNYQSENCGDLGGGNLDQFTTGSTLRAAYVASDMKLIELDSYPDPAFGVTYAGWDRNDLAPASAVAIHSPGADEKCISFEFDQTSLTSYLSEVTPGDRTHICIESWNLGTTEPGSSGSPLFNSEHHIVGQLHGGYASCIMDTADWYGRLFVSWEGGGTAASRLRDWLDPQDTGITVLDTYDPLATGLGVIPLTGLVSAGDPGGPFSPSSQVYTLSNKGEETLAFSASSVADWISISPNSGSISAGGTIQVTVSINAVSDTMSVGYYDGFVSFQNTTTGEGNATREVQLTVGQRDLAVSFNMDHNPGWSMEGAWEWGVPAGAAAEYGGPDPTSGSTGANVLGYNLQGAYGNLMAATDLTSSPINCRGLQQVRLRFQRWLGVEVARYDHAILSISNDGNEYHTVWANPESSEVADVAWTEVEYDISPWADDEATVFLRWTMGTTDDSYVYCGWNIDDVQLWAFGEIIVDPGPEKVAILSAVPNPFRQYVTIRYECNTLAEVSARVINLHGAVVADLGSEIPEIGENTWAWGGRTSDGQRLASGVYILEIRSAHSVDRTKIIYLH